MIAYGLTNKGLVRKDNEDDYLCCLNRGLFVVADGMGGHSAGEVASSTAIQVINDLLRDPIISDAEKHLEQVVQTANKAIFDKASQNQEYAGMGTTLTLAKVYQQKLWIAHVGDSRIYLIRNNQVNLLTEDHSMVSELVKRGQISEVEAEHHPQKHMLTRALGTSPLVEVDTLSIDIQPEDILVLCTDGLSNMVSSEQMKCTLLSRTVELGVKELMDIALARGGHDNITLIAAKY